MENPKTAANERNKAVEQKPIQEFALMLILSH